MNTAKLAKLVLSAKQLNALHLLLVMLFDQENLVIDRCRRKRLSATICSIVSR